MRGARPLVAGSIGRMAPLVLAALVGAASAAPLLRAQAPRVVTGDGTTRASDGSAAVQPRVSYWRHPKNQNMMRLEEWPDGEVRFWAHRLDPRDQYTREVLAKRGLEIDVREMTDEYVLRFCGFGYDNGLKYVEATPNGGTFEAIVAVGFDFFRGVDHPRYGDTRWKVTVRHVGSRRLYIGGKLIGWRGLLLLGQVKAEAELEPVAQPPQACTPSPVYPVRRREQARTELPAARSVSRFTPGARPQ